MHRDHARGGLRPRALISPDRGRRVEEAEGDFATDGLLANAAVCIKP
jgi:hypothetical protein